MQTTPFKVRVRTQVTKWTPLNQSQYSLNCSKKNIPRHACVQQLLGEHIEGYQVKHIDCTAKFLILNDLNIWYSFNPCGHPSLVLVYQPQGAVGPNCSCFFSLINEIVQTSSKVMGKPLLTGMYWFLR